MKAKDKAIVVTGGGSGMGRELVFLLLAKGAKVVAVDINERSTRLHRLRVTQRISRFS